MDSLRFSLWGVGTKKKQHRYTRDVKDSELCVPRRVFEDGSFDTYALPSYYDRREVDERRRKRSSSLTGARQTDEDKLHLVLPFKGIDHHVELFPYHEFISPELVIEARGPGIGTDLNQALRFNRVSDQQCHYRGIVRDHDYSRAALSLCDGVVRTLELMPLDGYDGSDGFINFLRVRRLLILTAGDL